MGKLPRNCCRISFINRIQLCFCWAKITEIEPESLETKSSQGRSQAVVETYGNIRKHFILFFFVEYLHPRKLTWIPKMAIFKRICIFQGPSFWGPPYPSMLDFRGVFQGFWMIVGFRSILGCAIFMELPFAFNQLVLQ